MPLLAQPQFKAPQVRMFQVPQPCSGGLNLLDLEYEQDPNQSPNVLNMMYRNGAFGKRYGQELYKEYTETIYNIGLYKGEMYIHSGDKLYKDGTETPIYTGLAKKKGLFINFNRMLYYMLDKYYVIDTTGTFKEVEPYVPDIVINRKPDGTTSDTVEDYNRVGTAFKNTFHGDGTSTEYILTDKNLDQKAPKIEVDTRELTSDEYTIDYVNGKVTFVTAPPKGTNNVVIQVYKTEQKYIDSIMNSKYYTSYGGENNSRLFLAGGGESIYYYSDVFDATYFPETNYATIGNTEDDITGFGEQYDVLIIFKPKELFALEYYVKDDGTGGFTSKQVNARIGCDVPNSIQLVNNQLVWCSTINGVCILVSTNIEDERNIRVISRNIDGGYRTDGLMNEANLKDAVSVDWDNKYFLTINGRVYLWDYLLTPYANTGRLDADAKRLAWFLFDNFNVDAYIKSERHLCYIKDKQIVLLNNNYSDFGSPIHAIYQSPLFQFDAVEYLKTVKNMYVQVRADTVSKITAKYVTEDSPSGEMEKESIIVYGKLYNNFNWGTFGWTMINFGNTFRRKCSLKKVQMAGVIFENNEVDRDMSISHLAFQYLLVKEIK